MAWSIYEIEEHIWQWANVFKVVCEASFVLPPYCKASTQQVNVAYDGKDQGIYCIVRIAEPRREIGPHSTEHKGII